MQRDRLDERGSASLGVGGHNQTRIGLSRRQLGGTPAASSTRVDAPSS